MKAFPYRASKLVQYCHLIHTADQSYTWENVYMYDKDFRLHLARHPKRSWAIILQQAWSVRLKDKLKHSSQSSSHSNRSDSWKDICKRFNRGDCASGNDCKYEHRCSFCFKFGHGVINCRKLKALRWTEHRHDQHDRYDRYDRHHHHDKWDRTDKHGTGGSDHHRKNDKKAKN